MSRKIKNKKGGICRLCGKETMLSFEHFPPKKPFNKSIRYRHVDPIEIQDHHGIHENKITGRIYEGPIGDHSLCVDCNNFLNKNYVRHFYKLQICAHTVISDIRPDSDIAHFRINDLNFLRALKHIISMFIAMNDYEISANLQKDLVEYINNPSTNYLPDKYRIYMYLVRPGSFRKFKWTMGNAFGMISEFAHYPLGFVISYENLPLPVLCEITPWKYFNSEGEFTADFFVPVLSIDSFIPLDYRSKEILNKFQINKGEKL